MPTAPSTSAPANPFSTRFVRPGHTPYRFADGEDADAVAAATISQLICRGTAAIIGPHGTGKSTLLHTLVPRLSGVFPQVQWMRLSSASDAVEELRQWQREQAADGGASPAGAGCLVIDGFEQLPWWARQRLMWRARRPLRRWPSHARRLTLRRRFTPHPCLLVTAHRPQLGIRTVYRTGWDNALVHRLTAEKLRDLPEPARQAMLRLAEQQATRLSHGRTADRNVRDYWFSLYDEYERLRAHDSFAADTRWSNAR